MTEGADVVGVKSDHEMAAENEIPEQLASKCIVTSPQPKSTIPNIPQHVDPILTEPLVELTIDDETRKQYQSKVVYFEARIKLFQRFGLE